MFSYRLTAVSLVVPGVGTVDLEVTEQCAVKARTVVTLVLVLTTDPVLC